MLRVEGVTAEPETMTLMLGEKKVDLCGLEEHLRETAASLRAAARDNYAEVSEQIILEALMHCIAAGVIMVQTQAPLVWRRHAPLAP